MTEDEFEKLRREYQEAQIKKEEPVTENLAKAREASDAADLKWLRAKCDRGEKLTADEFAVYQKLTGNVLVHCGYNEIASVDTRPNQSLLTYAVALSDPSPEEGRKYKNMADAFDACRRAGVEPPRAVLDFFGSKEPGSTFMPYHEKRVPCSTLYRDGHRRYVVNLRDVPAGSHSLVFVVHEPLPAGGKTYFGGTFVKTTMPETSVTGTCAKDEPAEKPSAVCPVESYRQAGAQACYAVNCDCDKCDAAREKAK